MDLRDRVSDVMRQKPLSLREVRKSGRHKSEVGRNLICQVSACGAPEGVELVELDKPQYAHIYRKSVETLSQEAGSK